VLIVINGDALCVAFKEKTGISVSLFLVVKFAITTKTVVLWIRLVELVGGYIKEKRNASIIRI
jgi:hypothetical protein